MTPAMKTPGSGVGAMGPPPSSRAGGRVMVKREKDVKSRIQEEENHSSTSIAEKENSPEVEPESRGMMLA